MELDDRERKFLLEARVGRLATVSGAGKPHVIPICFALVKNLIYSPIDSKPKGVPPKGLKRIRNILANPSVCLVIDVWSEDWSSLGYLLITGRAEVIESGKEYEESLAALEDKYTQYREMGLAALGMPVIKITLEKKHAWGNLV